MKPPFKFAWELVTPAMATQWLKKNTKNRNLRATTVNAFATDMQRGAWSPTHQGIAFEVDGTLIDGQHRLAAIVRSGVSIPFLICRDVPKRVQGVGADVMDAIDRGNQRSIADVLKLAHGMKVDANLVAAMCVMIARLGLGIAERERAKKVTLPQTLAILALYRGSVKFVSENRPWTIGLRAAPVCAAVAFAHAIEPKATEEFYRKFATGVGIEEGSPVLTLRNHLLNGGSLLRGSTRERTAQAEQVLHSIYCFIHSLELERMPRENQKNFAGYFRDKQPANVREINRIFPKLDEPVITAANVKLTPAAEALLQGKEISDREHGRTSGRTAKMLARIERGELQAATR